MTEFKDLRLVTADGLEAPADPSNPDSPYSRNWYESDIARKVANSLIKEIRWNYKSKEISFTFNCSGGIDVALDPASDLLLSTAGGDSRFAIPANAIIINPDGTVNHQIVPPPYVEIEPPHSQAGKHVVESISDLYIDENGQPVIGLDFHYEWVERRHYDPLQKKWAERVLIYRK